MTKSKSDVLLLSRHRESINPTYSINSTFSSIDSAPSPDIIPQAAAFNPSNSASASRPASSFPVAAQSLPGWTAVNAHHVSSRQHRDDLAYSLPSNLCPSYHPFSGPDQHQDNLPYYSTRPSQKSLNSPASLYSQHTRMASSFTPINRSSQSPARSASEPIHRPSIGSAPAASTIPFCPSCQLSAAQRALARTEEPDVPSHPFSLSSYSSCPSPVPTCPESPPVAPTPLAPDRSPFCNCMRFRRSCDGCIKYGFYNTARFMHQQRQQTSHLQAQAVSHLETQECSLLPQPTTTQNYSTHRQLFSPQIKPDPDVPAQSQYPPSRDEEVRVSHSRDLPLTCMGGPMLNVERQQGQSQSLAIRSSPSQQDTFQYRPSTTLNRKWRHSQDSSSSSQTMYETESHSSPAVGCRPSPPGAFELRQSPASELLDVSSACSTSPRLASSPSGDTAARQSTTSPLTQERPPLTESRRINRQPSKEKPHPIALEITSPPTIRPSSPTRSSLAQLHISMKSDQGSPLEAKAIKRKHPPDTSPYTPGPPELAKSEDCSGVEPVQQPLHGTQNDMNSLVPFNSLTEERLELHGFVQSWQTRLSNNLCLDELDAALSILSTCLKVPSEGKNISYHFGVRGANTRLGCICIALAHWVGLRRITAIAVDYHVTDTQTETLLKVTLGANHVMKDRYPLANSLWETKTSNFKFHALVDLSGSQLLDCLSACVTEGSTLCMAGNAYEDRAWGLFEQSQETAFIREYHIDRTNTKITWTERGVKAGGDDLNLRNALMSGVQRFELPSPDPKDRDRTVTLRRRKAAGGFLDSHLDKIVVHECPSARAVLQPSAQQSPAVSLLLSNGTMAEPASRSGQSKFSWMHHVLKDSPIHRLFAGSP
ncbi:hypothetical protein K469DRAFT_755591 [Zopfia rhizophila CBS 207.26]|uniref:Uncharacterized protein n=1 Tax=Zopfia rhizophila CBS 207.26 TaxID=1314779 RepID=A0A6A6DF01_9PEZI|nr:hypothetical protein K469DRAFT_755591 [Zopfia rhizophila CBS 207.26]